MKKLINISFATSLAVAAIILTSFVEGQHNTEVQKEKIDNTGNSGFAVVELFTSQGCSSCPPAEDLVAKVQEENIGKPVYILAFHVDYWNHQGWKDVFSDREFTKRQYQYASWLKTETVYTPQIVVNGKREFIGSQEATLNNALTTSLHATFPSSLSLNANLNSNKIKVQYQSKGADHNTSLQLALVQKVAQTTVKRGENAGRILSHVQIVRQIQNESVSSTGSGYAELLIPAGFDPKGWEVIGFLQNNNNGEIFAAGKQDFKVNI